MGLFDDEVELIFESLWVWREMIRDPSDKLRCMTMEDLKDLDSRLSMLIHKLSTHEAFAPTPSHGTARS